MPGKERKVKIDGITYDMNLIGRCAFGGFEGGVALAQYLSANTGWGRIGIDITMGIVGAALGGNGRTAAGTRYIS